jgi:3-deoxy-D-manno-octulosonic-acid transferase
VPINFYDIVYGIAATATAPIWLLHPRARRKVFAALDQRMGRDTFERGSGAAVFIHAVSLGEINATRTLVTELRRRRPGLRFVISATTEAGFDRGMSLYGSEPDVAVIRYPLDLSAAVQRTLAAARPDVVVLMELEVWPNFVSHCARQRIPVLLVNGRLTETSLGRYRWVRPLVAPTFRRLWRLCVQDEVYRDRFISLGCDPARVEVTGTMKFDSAALGAAADAGALAKIKAEMGLSTGPVWVCGSTGPGEEALLLDVYRRLLGDVQALRLVLVPRKPERFEEVAGLVQATGSVALRRSHVKSGKVTAEAAAAVGPRENPPVVLIDTLGELRDFYALASVVFVGRSLVDLGPRQHGSDMIEPAALGKPIVVGPFTGNFADAMTHFRRAAAVTEVADAPQLYSAMMGLLKNPAAAAAIGAAARQVTQDQRGASARHAEIVLAAMDAGKTVGALPAVISPGAL